MSVELVAGNLGRFEVVSHQQRRKKPGAVEQSGALTASATARTLADNHKLILLIKIWQLEKMFGTAAALEGRRRFVGIDPASKDTLPIADKHRISWNLTG